MTEPLDMDPVNAVPHYMMRFAHHLLKSFKNSTGEKYNLNRTQFRTLILLKRRGSLTMSDLVAHLNIEKGSMTSVVDSLIAADLVFRERSENDRRCVITSLTPRGRALALDLDEQLKRHIQNKLEQLGKERADALLGMMDLIRDSLDIWENNNE